jgi:hypothetical protein
MASCCFLERVYNFIQQYVISWVTGGANAASFGAVRSSLMSVNYDAIAVWSQVDLWVSLSDWVCCLCVVMRGCPEAVFRCCLSDRILNQNAWNDCMVLLLDA